MSDKTMIKLGALWLGETKQGERMMSGSINGDCRILVLKNRFKEEDKHPDYLLYLVPAEKKNVEKKEPESDLPF